jgi:AraC-like DNA-binding protein
LFCIFGLDKPFTMDQRIEQAIFFITKNYYKPLLLDAICASVRLSKFHFHRMFRSDTGMTPLQFWHQIRIQHAQHFALQYPSSKQLEVGFICGYVSPPIFARAFQKQMEMSMLQFRAVNSTAVASHKIDERILPFDIVYLIDQTGVDSKKESFNIPNDYYLKLKFESKKTLREELSQMTNKVTEQAPQVQISKKPIILNKSKANVAYYSLKLK